MRKRLAVTLVEVLIVIGIILVIAAIVFPVFSAGREKSMEIRSISNMQQIYVALEIYRSEYNGIPVGKMEDMGLPPWPTEQYLGPTVAALYPPKRRRGLIYYYYPAPDDIDHRNPTWSTYVVEHGDSTVLLADVWFNPSEPTGGFPAYHFNPYVEKYVFGITVGGSLRKKRAAGALSLTWWD